MRVCKTWRNIILQPDFADLHLSRSTRSTDDTLLCYIKEDSKIYTLVPIESPTIARENLLVFATPKQLPVLNSQDSVNGLFCLSNLNLGEGDAGCTFYIYNPLLKEYAVLPRPPTPNCSTEDDFVEVFDFLFCPKTSQYKVLRGVTTYSSGVEISKRCEIYTLGTPAWREVSNALVDELSDHLFVLDCVFNGAIHLLVKRQDKGKVMLCFDLEIEQFVSFPQPPVDTNYDLKNLGVLDNCLIATGSTDDMYYAGIFEVWVMQEYMKEDSWTRKWEIDYYSAKVDWDSWLYRYGVHYELIKLLSDGRLVVSFFNQIYFYDIEKRRLTKSELPDKSWFLHTPTFVSPKNLMGQISSNDNEITKDPTCKRMRLC